MSDDITAQEWSSCAHPPDTMNFLAGQSNVRMAGDFHYAAAQASALMVAAADRVCHANMSKTWLKTLQVAVTSIREELQDSKDERQVLFEQNCIVACKKATL
ncbi:unnamed protein product [Lactuca saligna]|uniref:Uncharacterized protein n=1 Tax=Lactuca saligna TaxID=75948 RepID=A0AA35UQ03_LACSI|nr:unnamed protein product [Lactuca saligna]